MGSSGEEFGFVKKHEIMAFIRFSCPTCPTAIISVEVVLFWPVNAVTSSACTFKESGKCTHPHKSKCTATLEGQMHHLETLIQAIPPVVFAAGSAGKHLSTVSMADIPASPNAPFMYPTFPSGMLPLLLHVFPLPNPSMCFSPHETKMDESLVPLMQSMTDGEASGLPLLDLWVEHHVLLHSDAAPLSLAPTEQDWFPNCTPLHTDVNPQILWHLITSYVAPELMDRQHAQAAEKLEPLGTGGYAVLQGGTWGSSMCHKLSKAAVLVSEVITIFIDAGLHRSADTYDLFDPIEDEVHKHMFCNSTWFQELQQAIVFLNAQRQWSEMQLPEFRPWMMHVMYDTGRSKSQLLR
ncbi:hypothetical protein B0H10DRAFT_1956967 [Mycena sp. CBHHK59/15]|nr:hypothetical protein B0H10DRAFT_1956967 [Mycena sp. CBHHK59/15]